MTKWQRLLSTVFLSLGLPVMAMTTGCGDGFDKMASPTTQSLKSIWGSGPSDVWAVGKFGTILHFDGAAWSESPSGASYTLRAVWGSGPNAVWAVGDAGTVLFWNGSTWSKSTIAQGNDLEDVWGSGPSDVWAVPGNNAKTLYAVMHWDGSTWSEVKLGVDALPERIAGSGPSDVWMTQNALDGQKLLHWDGSKWESVKIEVSGVYLWNDLVVTGPRQVWLVGRDVANSAGMALRFDGSKWSPAMSNMLALASPEGAFARGPQDIWLVGSWGSVIHFDGTDWKQVHGTDLSSGFAINTDMLNAAWGPPTAGLFAVGDYGVILHSAK